MKKITVLDIVITSIFLLLIIVFTANYFLKAGKNDSTLFIRSENETYYYSLNQKKTVIIKGAIGNTIIEIDNGKFSFSESACSNKDCIKMGWISMANFPVVCLPNKVSAYIIKNKKIAEFDGLSR